MAAGSLAHTLDWLTGNRLPALRESTQHLSALHPYFGESGLIDPRTGRKAGGLYVGEIGADGQGGAHFFDEFLFHASGLLHNPNVMVLGQIDHRKSALVKTIIYRGAAVGYNHLVTDRKGEYTRLAEAIAGSVVLRFGDNTRLFINPLDSSMSHETQADLVAAMTLTALGDGRPALSVIERSLISEAVKVAHLEHGDSALLQHALELLFAPTPAMCESLRDTSINLQASARNIALGLRRLTEGDLRGMFHQPTTPGLLQDTPLLVLNCEGLQGERAIVMITLINFFSQSQMVGNSGRLKFHRVIHDEAWDLAKYPGFADSVRRAFKLGRSLGVANWLIMHHLANLERSSERSMIHDLIADTDTVISYRQDSREIQSACHALGLHPSYAETIANLVPGVALHRVGSQQPLLVQHMVWPEELPLLHTTPWSQKERQAASNLVAQ